MFGRLKSKAFIAFIQPPDSLSPPIGWQVREIVERDATCIAATLTHVGLLFA